nr:ParB/RepB/Spo0J family partition protein [Desulfobulbaceae bacterium]
MMTPILRINRISLSHIDLTDNSYTLLPFDPAYDTETICTHVSKTGIILPPVLKENSTGSYCLISGRDRVTAAQTMALSSLDCFIIPRECSEEQVYTIVLNEAIIHGQLSPIEKAVFFQKALQIWPLETVAELFLPVLKLPQRTSTISKLLPLANIEQPIAEAIHEGSFDEKAACELAKLSFRDRIILFEAISKLHLSVSNQRKLISYCLDLSLRHNSSIQSILSSNEVQAIINHEEANTPQKAANLMIYLQSSLTPRHTEAQKTFNTLKQSLRLPKYATLTHATAFEKDDLTLSITFKDSKSLLEFCDSSFNTEE